MADIVGNHPLRSDIDSQGPCGVFEPDGIGEDMVEQDLQQNGMAFDDGQIVAAYAGPGGFQFWSEIF